jgi:hypothetical protein
MIYEHKEVKPLKEWILDISSTQKLNEVIERLNQLSFEIYSDAPEVKEHGDWEYSQ